MLTLCRRGLSYCLFSHSVSQSSYAYRVYTCTCILDLPMTHVRLILNYSLLCACVARRCVHVLVLFWHFGMLCFASFLGYIYTGVPAVKHTARLMGLFIFCIGTYLCMDYNFGYLVYLFMGIHASNIWLILIMFLWISHLRMLDLPFSGYWPILLMTNYSCRIFYCRFLATSYAYESPWFALPLES